MQATRVLWHRQPMIRFLGKRTVPQKVDHSPHVHPAAPDNSLPESFAQYRNRAIQHGPLGGQQQNGSSGGGSAPVGHIGGSSAKQLGPITLSKGEVWDRNELPERFRRTTWSLAEMEAIDSGGASLYA